MKHPLFQHSLSVLRSSSPAWLPASGGGGATPETNLNPLLKKKNSFPTYLSLLYPVLDSKYTNNLNYVLDLKKQVYLLWRFWIRLCFSVARRLMRCYVCWVCCVAPMCAWVAAVWSYVRVVGDWRCACVVGDCLCVFGYVCCCVPCCLSLVVCVFFRSGILLCVGFYNAEFGLGLVERSRNLC